MLETVKAVGQKLATSSDLTLLLLFLVLTAGTVAAITLFLIRKHLPQKWGGGKDADVPFLSRDWFNKLEERAKRQHEQANKIGALELARPRWDDAVTATEAHAKEIGAIRTKLDQVSARVHEFSGKVGEITQLGERVDSLEARHEGHMTDSLKQADEMSTVKVGVARLEEQMKGVKESTDRIDRNVEKLTDRFFGPTTPMPRRRSDG